MHRQYIGFVCSIALMLVPVPAVAQEISVLQGAEHRSSFAEQGVATGGIVTAVVGSGFFLQGEPDGNLLTSDGIFVFTRDEPDVDVGDLLQVRGELVEFARSNQLPLTQIKGASYTVLSSGNPLPEPLPISTAENHPPTEIIDDDGFASFDPQTDGIDYYETLEGMRVTIKDAIALSTKSRHDEVWVLPSNGAAATNFVDGHAITLTETDANPERILIDFEILGKLTEIEAGKRLGDITGVFSYDFGNYRVFATEIETSEERVNSEAYQTNEAPSDAALTIAVYNVENLDPKVEVLPKKGDVDDDVGSGKFGAIATQIVDVLHAPAIIALQEVQDNDGAENTPVTSASETLQTLVTAISAKDGPRYDILDYPPGDDQDGGQPGGNIRNAFLYDPNRAQLVADSAYRILDIDGAFEGSRKPVTATFKTAAGELSLFNVHFSSRGGSDTSFGSNQPPVIGKAAVRRKQSQAVGEVVSTLLGRNPTALVIVLGDFNAHYFERELTLLEDEYDLFNLWHTLPSEARRSYVYEGQAQAYDHMLISAALKDRTTFAPANINAGRLAQASDHDPLLATIASPSSAVLSPNEKALLLTSMSGTNEGANAPPAPPTDLMDADLREWLREHWFERLHESQGYDAARRAMYSFVDVADDGRVYGVYTGFNQEARNVTFLNPINPEHTVPQSWFNEAEPMRSDIHHLFPTHKDVNAARGSDPFAEISDSVTTRWYGLAEGNRVAIKTQPPTQDIDLYSEDAGTEFEPPEAHEGNLARAVFYFYTMYPGQAGDINDLASDGITQFGVWHQNDQVDDWERKRNERIAKVQGNRNPFIEHPDLVCRAWSNAC